VDEEGEEDLVDDEMIELAGGGVIGHPRISH
jgi:ribulose 1,5-bisphosphate carboxylase large subunit-like protein